MLENEEEAGLLCVMYGGASKGRIVPYISCSSIGSTSSSVSESSEPDPDDGLKGSRT